MLCLYQAGSTLTGNPCLGLAVGEAVRADGLHQLGYALMSCETVGEALAVNLRFQPLVMGQGRFDTQVTDDTVTLSWRPDGASPALLRPINESILASWVRFGQWITGSAATPMSVTFCHARPTELSAYHRIFQCPLTFEGASNSLTGPRFLLDLPLKQANPGLKQALLSAMEAQLPQHAPQPMDWLAQVKQALQMTLHQPGEFGLGFVQPAGFHQQAEHIDAGQQQQHPQHIANGFRCGDAQAHGREQAAKGALRPQPGAEEAQRPGQQQQRGHSHVLCQHHQRGRGDGR